MAQVRERFQSLIAAFMTALLVCIAITGLSGGLTMAAEVNEDALRQAVTLYASFDEAVKADLGGGERTLRTRSNDRSKPGQFVFEQGFDTKSFRIAKGKGIHGGALEVGEVLPNNGRIFFPARGNIAYKKGGWGGAVSLWINTDPTEMIKSRFCDPVQITQKGANDGGIWVDFNEAQPRDMRMGIFPAARAEQQAIKEDAPDAPLIRFPRVAFKSGEWHHLALTWNNCDTGKANAQAAFYVDGLLVGELKDREIGMDWSIEQAGIYVAVNYIGLLDELALFNRSLTPMEVARLHQRPSLLAGLASTAVTGEK